MDEFEASNGYRIVEAGGEIRVIDDSADNALNGFDFLDPSDMLALSEYVRAKDDERLGRWRHPDYPTYAAYRHHENWINVVEEESGLSSGHRRQDVEAVRHLNFVSTTEQVARLYYDAHPKPGD